MGLQWVLVQGVSGGSEPGFQICVVLSRFFRNGNILINQQVKIYSHTQYNTLGGKKRDHNVIIFYGIMEKWNNGIVERRNRGNSPRRRKSDLRQLADLRRSEEDRQADSHRFNTDYHREGEKASVWKTRLVSDSIKILESFSPGITI